MGLSSSSAAAHATSHENGGSDEVDATGLDGVTGGSAFAGAHAHRATNQAFTAFTDAALSFSSDAGTFDYDTGAVWAIGQPTRFVADQDGYWDVDASVFWDGDTTGTRQLYVVVNGSAFFPASELAATAAGFMNQRLHEPAIFLSNGDYVEVFAYPGPSVQLIGGDGMWGSLTFRGA